MTDAPRAEQGGVLFTPATDQQIAINALITASRSLTDAVDRLDGRLEKMVGKVDEIHTDLTKLKALGFKEEIEKLEIKIASLKDTLSARIGALESQRDRFAGMASLWNWLVKSVPVLIVGGLAYLAGVLKLGSN
jgi:hypothetical protein